LLIAVCGALDGMTGGDHDDLQAVDGDKTKDMRKRSEAAEVSPKTGALQMYGTLDPSSQQDRPESVQAVAARGGR
jgi:hypothetical protein